MSNFRVDVYTNPHKEQRELMFNLSLQVAQEAEINKIVTLARVLFDKLHQHAWSEDTYLHPMVKPKVHHLLDHVEKDHQSLDAELAQLEASVTGLAMYNLTKEKGVLLLNKFYVDLNHFIGNYLLHLAAEESLLPTYWEHCEPYELFAIMVAFKANDDREEFPKIMGFAMQHLNEGQRIAMFKVMRERLGDQISSASFDMAKDWLSEGERKAVEPVIGDLRNRKIDNTSTEA